MLGLNKELNKELLNKDYMFSSEQGNISLLRAARRLNKEFPVRALSRKFLVENPKQKNPPDPFGPFSDLNPAFPPTAFPPRHSPLYYKTLRVCGVRL